MEQWRRGVATSRHLQRVNEWVHSNWLQQTVWFSELLIERADAIFEDTATEYSDFGMLIRRFTDWLQTNPRSFRDAYVAECIPKLVGPFVRIELFSWNPLNVQNMPLHQCNWYQSILRLNSNNEGIDMNDPAINNLIPDIVEKVVLPKFTSKSIYQLTHLRCFRNSQWALEPHVPRTDTAIGRTDRAIRLHIPDRESRVQVFRQAFECDETEDADEFESWTWDPSTSHIVDHGTPKWTWSWTVEL